LSKARVFDLLVVKLTYMLFKGLFRGEEDVLSGVIIMCRPWIVRITLNTQYIHCELHHLTYEGRRPPLAPLIIFF
jgi:hypothetical protein